MPPGGPISPGYPIGGPPPSSPGGGNTKILIAALIVMVVVLVGVGAVALTRRGGETIAVPGGSTTTAATSESATSPQKKTTSTDRSEIDPDRTTTTRRPSTTTTPPTTEAPPVWTVWTAPDGRFTIEFPRVPTVEAIQVSVPQLQSASQATSDTADAAYLVAWYDLAPNYYVADPNAVLNAGMDSFASGASLTFTRRDLGDFAGNPALFFAGSTAGGIVLQGQVIISGTRMYLFAGGSLSGVANDYERFLNSFHIT